MRSFCAYIEGMDCLHIHFMVTNGSDLAAWARFGTLALFERCLLLLNVLVLPNSSTHVATLYLGPMRSLWAYIEGMDGLHIHFMVTNGSDLAAWARFGTLALFERCLLLLNVLVLPNSSTHVATLYLGPMRSLWAYIEGMDGLHIHFMVTNGSDLAAWARFGTLALFERCLLLLNVLVLPNSSTHVATLYLGPMRSLWAYIEGMDGLHIHFMVTNGSDLAAWARFGTLALFERCLLLLNVLVLPNSSTHVATLYLGPMRSLWAYIEGMDGLHIHFMVTNGSDLAAWARFGTLALFERCLLLLNVLVLPNSSTHVATLYLGPMRSLWAYIEGMDGLHIHFMVTNGSDLAAWARFGTLALFERCLLLLNVLVLPNSSTHVATLYLGPMRSLWAYIEGMDGLHIHFMVTNGSDLAAWARFGTLALFERCLLLLNVLVLPNSSTHVATLYLGPMRSLWAYIEGMDGLHIHFMVTNGSDLAAWARFGTLALFERCLLLLNVLVLPNSSTHVATLYLGPMRSLWAYIEGMDGLHIHFMVTNGSDLAAWARFGTLALFERCLLLLNVLVLPNSSTHVATLYLGPMRSLWAYIEGMDGLHIHFMVTNGSDLAAWARFGTLALFERCLLLLNVLVLPNSSTHVARLCLGPMRSLWAYIEGMDCLHIHFMVACGSDLASWDMFGTLALFERCLLLLNVLVLPNSSTHVARLYL